MCNRSLRSSVLVLAGILIGIGGCAESPAAPAARTEALQLLELRSAPRYDMAGVSGAVVGPEGGVVVGPGGVTLSFPKGALSRPTYISLRPSTEVVGVEILPHGLTFSAGSEPTLTLPYGGADVSGFSRLNVVYVEGGAITEVLSTSVSPGAHTLTARLPHFSFYAGAGN
jgi:hypothetical protein